MYGAVLFPHSSWNSAEKLILAPGELEKLKCMPVLFNGNFGFDLMMPLEINYDPENNRGTFIAFVAYRFPEKNHIETENLNNCDIFLWRIFLIPLPLLADVVTSPVQLFSLFLLSLSRK